MKTIITLILIASHGIGFAQLTNWYTRNTPTDKQLNCVHFPSETVGYIGGNDTLLLKTTDGGDNWLEIDFQGVTVFGGGEHITDIQFINESLGYMVIGPYGGTYKTTDGGINWSLVTVSGNFCYVDALHFFNGSDGVLGGGGCFEGELFEIISSAGNSQATAPNSWSSGPNAMITDIDFLNPSVGLAASADSRIYRTTNGGVDWDSIPVPVSTPLTSVKFINDTLVYAGYDDLGASFGLLISTDAGLSWGIDGGSATFYYPAFHEIITNHSNQIYVGAEASFDVGLIMEYTGQWWNYYNVDQPIRGMDSYSDAIVWAVGDSGYVVTNFETGSLHLFDEETKPEFHVFPNPCEEELNLSPISEDFTITTIKIFDLNGRAYLSFEHPNLSNSLNVSKLKSGVYHIQISNGDRLFYQKFVKN